METLRSSDFHLLLAARPSVGLIEAYSDRRFALGAGRNLECADEGVLAKPLIFAERRLETRRCPHRPRRLTGLGHAEGAVIHDIDHHAIVGPEHIVGMNVDAAVGTGKLPVPAARNDNAPDAGAVEVPPVIGIIVRAP